MGVRAGGIHMGVYRSAVNLENGHKYGSKKIAEYHTAALLYMGRSSLARKVSSMRSFASYAVNVTRPSAEGIWVIISTNFTPCMRMLTEFIVSLHGFLRLE